MRSGCPVMCRDEVHQLAIKRGECAERPVTQSHGALDDRIKHGLHISRRLTDDAKDLARRGFPVCSLRQRSLKLRDAVAQRCNFSEQVCVRLALSHSSVLTPAKSAPLPLSPASTPSPSLGTSS